MAYPTDIPSFTTIQGTTLLSVDDHAARHGSEGVAITALASKLGLSAGSAVANKILVGSGNGTSVWSQTWNQGTIGTVVISNGTVNATAGTIGNAVLGTPTITTPKIITSINDANGNEVIKTPATTSAVNEVTITNSATSLSNIDGPLISATGGDTNISLRLSGKGTGIVKVDGLWTGWKYDPITWTYASASTFTIAGVNMTGYYTKGTRVAWNEGATAKYGVVLSSTFSTNTTVTIAVNTDYVITNTTLSQCKYSHEASPAGYPTFFIYTPTFTKPTNLTATVSGTGYFNILGAKCSLHILWAQTSASGSGIGATWYATLPITAVTTFTGNNPSGSGAIQRTGAGWSRVEINGDPDKVQLWEYDNSAMPTGDNEFCIDIDYGI